jgi:hypothetical protein
MKTFEEQNYPCTIEVKVLWSDGDSITDQIKGLNEGHALYLAKLNWESASYIESLGEVK